MKKNKHINKIFPIVFLIMAIVFIFSCNRKPYDTKKLAEKFNEQKFEDINKEKDAQFLVNIAEINLGEIQLGELAYQHGKISEVKNLGKLMSDLHGKCLIELSILAKKKQITIPMYPTKSDKNAFKKLYRKVGVSFDKKYCTMMLNGQKNALDLFEKAALDASDEEIRMWAKEARSNLQGNLNNAITYQDN